MTPRQLEILQHALGCDKYGCNDHPKVRIPNPPYYRNHFCAGAGDEPDCRALVELGLMKQHETTTWLPYFNCSVTPAGIQAMKDASPAPPKLTRAQMRYREYLEADGCLGETFRDYLRNIQTDWYKRARA
jgi:hypothetical protein